MRRLINVSTVANKFFSRNIEIQISAFISYFVIKKNVMDKFLTEAISTHLSRETPKIEMANSANPDQKRLFRVSTVCKYFSNFLTKPDIPKLEIRLCDDSNEYPQSMF